MKKNLILGMISFVLLFGVSSIYAKQVVMKVQGNKIPVEDTTISKYANGKVKYASVTKAFSLKLGGVSYPIMANEYIYFYESGQIQLAYIAKDTKVGSFLIKGETAVTFFKNGKFQAGRLRSSVQAKGFYLYGEDVIVLDPKGSYLGSMLLESQSLRINNDYEWVSSGQFVAYDNAESYNVDALGTYSEGVYVNGNYLSFKDNDFIWIKYKNYESGQVEAILRMNDGNFTYKGKSYKATGMKPIYFDDSGNIKQ